MDTTVDTALLVLRVAFGIACVAHGWPKVRAIDKFAAGHHLPLWLAWIAALTQFFGGLAMITGLFARPAAVALVLFALFATYVLIVRKKEPFAAPDVHCWDSGVLYAVIPLAIALAGPGRFAVG